MIDKIKADLIAKAYYQPIYKFCLVNLSNNADDASDVTQDVFLFFQEKCEVLEDINIKRWLFSVASKKVKEHYRGKKKEFLKVPVGEAFEVVDDDADIFTLLEEQDSFDSENLEKYRNIVYEKLTENERLLYHKIYVEKKNYTQIAEEMNTTYKAITVRACRLRKKLELLEILVLCTVGQFILKLFF